jgi:diphosphomevalonate decarboxylase
MKAIAAVKQILGNLYSSLPQHKIGSAFAPVNIALCKYWGKRDIELNLPITSSFSVALPELGTRTSISILHGEHDRIQLNNQDIAINTQFAERLIEFLDFFRFTSKIHFSVTTTSNIPIGAGLASSASGFAALVLALDKLFGWGLPKQQLSILARLGSGSACRSLWNGFVKWHAGTAADGMDSFAEPMAMIWPDLMLGICMVSTAEKKISSRTAMQRTVTTSKYYNMWPEQVMHDLVAIEAAINKQDFNLLGEVVEANALAMHALMLTTQPPILYTTATTITLMEKVWQLRKAGTQVYFTQDAGPNLKLLFLRKDIALIKKTFNLSSVITLFPSDEYYE